MVKLIDYTLAEIDGTLYKLHHIAKHRGYESVKTGRFEHMVRYKGRFGEGFKEHLNLPNSTRYHAVVYWIKE